MRHTWVVGTLRGLAPVFHATSLLRSRLELGGHLNGILGVVLAPTCEDGGNRNSLRTQKHKVAYVRSGEFPAFVLGLLV